jgi:RND family efflux transporter MFP subunit
LEQDMANSEPQQRPGAALQGAVVAPTDGANRLPAVQPPPAAQPPRPARRRQRRWLLAAGIVLVGGLGLGLLLQPWATGPTLVMVEIAEQAPVARVLAVNGRIAARRSVDVRALVGGALAEVRVAEGDSVAMRAELARLDSAAPQAALRQAVAGLDAALVAQEQSRDTFARTEALGETVTRTALEAAARAVQSATQEVARTTALVDQAQVQLDNHTIRAPMTGAVLALYVEPGQSIDPSTVLMTVADLDHLVVETDVDEAYAVQVRTGHAAVLQLAGEASTRDGRVTRVSQRVDAATGGLAVEIAFDAPVAAPVGLTVTANIIVEARDAALTAPRAAIRADDGGHAVFVVVNGVAQRRAVSVIDWPAARLIVTDGLAPGDMMILDATGISDGQSVRTGQP